MTYQVIYIRSILLFLSTNIICFSQQNLLFHTELPVKFFDYHFYLGIDGLSTVSVYLTGLLCPLCILYCYGNKRFAVEYSIRIICVEVLLLSVFSVLDLFFLHVLFEAILIPFFSIIGLRGTRMRRPHAAYLLFFYTVFGSILTSIAIISMFNVVGTVNFQILWFHDYTHTNVKSIWWAFFSSFAIKIPMVPLHIRSPEAHVESPTEGSVILAGSSLKVGLYGFIRVSVQILYDHSIYYSSIVILIAMCSIFFASSTTLRQIDIKRIIAYSSIAHMNVCVLGIMSFQIVSLCGSVFLMFGHGVVSSGPFFAVGMLYDRCGTKIVKYYSGIVNSMPSFCSCFFLFVLGNISMPGTINFIGEFLISFGLFESYNLFALSLTLIGVSLCRIYTMWMYNKIAFGGMKKNFKIRDINYREFWILIPLVSYTLVLGIMPNYILDFIYLPCCYMLIH